MSKVIPVHKGRKDDVANYRPIANLCSASKIFERLILNRITQIEEIERVDLTGENQHGFKTGRSTLTAGMAIQSPLARAIDQGNFALMASLDLSSAFDVVNINLLLKRLTIIGLLSDIVDLIRLWLQERSYFVHAKGRNSYIVGSRGASQLGVLL